MDDTLRRFEKRTNAVVRKHRKLAHGYVTRLNRNGVIEHRPITTLKISPVRLLTYAIIVFVGFKALLLVALGPEEYSTRVERLAQGSFVERGGAFVMQIDPASALLAENILALRN